MHDFHSGDIITLPTVMIPWQGSENELWGILACNGLPLQSQKSRDATLPRSMGIGCIL